MSAEAVFIAELSKIKRWVILNSLQRAALDATLIFLGIWAGLWFIEGSEFTILSDAALRFGVATGISLTAALLFAVFRRNNLQNILIDIDTRLKLQDKLTTAYEYQRDGKKSDLLVLLLEDAARQLHQLEIKHMAPAKFSLAHLAVVLLLLINVGLYTSHLWGPHPRPTYTDQKLLEKSRTLLQNYTQSRIGGKPLNKLGAEQAYARQLEQLLKRLDDPALNQDSLSASLNTLRNEIQAEQARLADELGAKLDALKSEGVSVESIPEAEEFSSHKIQKLKKLLKGTLDNELPDSLNQDIETFQAFSSMEKLLSQIIEDLKENDSIPEEVAKSQPDKTQTSKHAKDRSENRKDGQHPESGDGMSNTKQGRVDTTRPSASDQFQDSDGDGAADTGLHDEYDLSAGHAKSFQQKKSPGEIEKSTGPGIQDKLSSASEKKYRVHIRSLSTFGESKMQEENIVQTYRQEIESILQKEEIPLNYREYIKHYFISIGLKTEAKAYDTN